MLFLRIVFPFFIFSWLLPSSLPKTSSATVVLKKGATDTSKAFHKNFYPEKQKKDEIITHTAFTLCYDEEYEQAKWVAYRLTVDMVEKNEKKRTDNFRADKDVKTGSATPDDYKKSGYDRGHLCPAGDMAWNNKTMSESFLMSNMSPQKPAFNRGIWKTLESDVRSWAKTNEELYIVTGGVLQKTKMETIGANKVAVPEYYYKVILDLHEPGLKAIAFILPNEQCKKQIFDYAVTIDSVEKLTQINFFPALPDSIENSLESHFDADLWK